MKNPYKIKVCQGLKGSQAEAKNYALRLLSYRSRSRKEMFEKLRRKGFDSRQIKSAVESLENAGLIKDEALAKELFRNAAERKYLGRKGIEMFLSGRGIQREIIDETMLIHTKEMEKDSARKIVEKKLKALKKYPGNIIRRRLWGMLEFRGFSADIINMTVKAVSNKKD